MERLRFDPYAPVNRVTRQIGRETQEVFTDTCPCTPATSPVIETGLARAFIIPQDSIYPMFDLCEGWRKGSAFTALEKPLEGVNRCGRK